MGQSVRSVVATPLGRFHAHLADCAAGAEIVLSAAESHHLLRVMRARPGDRLRVFGGGLEFTARLVHASRGIATVALEQRLQPPPAPAVAFWPVIPFLKGGRTEFLAEKLTEMGAAGIIAYSAAREVARASKEKLDRLQRVVLSACKQCERADVPPVLAAESLASALQAGPASARRFVLVERNAGPRLGEIVAATRSGGESNPSVVFASGPEGGFDPAELAACGPCIAASLGPRILRADTAPIMAAAVILHAYDEL